MSDPIMSTEDINFLFVLRKRKIRGVRKDFENMFPNVLSPLCNLHEDTLTNLIECQELRAVPKNGATHEDLWISREMQCFRSNIYFKPETGS